MTREEFATIAKILKAVYSKGTFLPNRDSVAVWYEGLKDLPLEVVEMAVKRYIVTETFPPTISDIRSQVLEITMPELSLSDGEAWALTMGAIYNVRFPHDDGYEDVGRKKSPARREFDNLPRVCQMAVGSPSVLEKWAYGNEELIQSTIQSNFLRSYRTAQEQARKEAMIPTEMREAIEQARPKPQLPENEVPALEQNEADEDLALGFSWDDVEDETV